MYDLDEPVLRLRRPELEREVRAWSLLGLAALAVAGVLALLLAFSRTPVIQDWLPWKLLEFFGRALVTHVMFSFVVWYLAILGTMTVLAVDAIPDVDDGLSDLGRAGFGCVFLAFILLLAPALMDWGQPSLNNYVPVVIHPLYLGGVVCLFVGLTLAVLRLLRTLGRASGESSSLVFAVALAGGMYLSAMLCFVIAWSQMPSSADLLSRMEHGFWGGGHVLQFVNSTLLLIGWQLAGEWAFGHPPLTPRMFRINLLLMVPFVVAAPFLYAIHPALDPAHKEMFTLLFRYGIVVPPALAALSLLVQAVRCRDQFTLSNSVQAGLTLSVLAFGIGGVMGYFLGAIDTRIPSHYHAEIGGVNLATMLLYVVLFLPMLGRRPPGRRVGLAMFGFYGIGQLVWSTGMFIAGSYGVLRKTAGAAQGLDSSIKMWAMGITGTGGLIAVIGGVIFVWVVLARLLRKPPEFP